MKLTLDFLIEKVHLRFGLGWSLCFPASTNLSINIKKNARQTICQPHPHPNPLVQIKKYKTLIGLRNC